MSPVEELPAPTLYSTGADSKPYGTGVYYFQGVRTLPNNSICSHAEFVRVGLHTVGKYTGYYVVFFGRATRYRPEAFTGTWVKVKIDLIGDYDGTDGR